MKYELIAQPNEACSPIEQILMNRGFEYSEIQHYLNTSDDDILDPELIANIKEGVKMLVKNIRNNSKTAIIVDQDCDGFTSSAILTNYLYRLFPNFTNSLIHIMHPGKQHGIILDELPDDIEFVIAPDSATNDCKQHEALKKRGVDILIIDHHEAETVSENACIINNQICDYPTKSLSGAGMVYKFCSYIDKLLDYDYADDYLDLVALGLIADVMRLNDFETKRLIEKGIANVQNPFMKEMIDKNSFSIGKELTPTGIAFYVAPFVNAVARIGTIEEKTLLFESMLDYKAYELVPSTKRGCSGDYEPKVKQACRSCVNIKNRQTKQRNENIAIAEELIKERDLLKNKVLVIKIDCNKNLTGLVANVLMDKYKRPVLLLNQVERDGEIYWEGSGRGYTKCDLKDFKKMLMDCGLGQCGGWAQGHANAFGLSVPSTAFDEYFERVEDYLKDFEFSPNYQVDFIYGMSDCNPDNILEIAQYKNLWGQGVEEPKLVFEHISVTKDNITLMSPDKNPTIKITLPNGITFIKFKVSEEEYELLNPDDGQVILNIVGRCERNEWLGHVTPQIIIEDYDIVNSYEYYF